MNKPINLAKEETRRDLKRVADPKHTHACSILERIRFDLKTLVNTGDKPVIREAALSLDAILEANGDGGIEELLAKTKAVSK